MNAPANRRFLVKCYFGDNDALNKCFGLFDTLQNLTPKQKKEYSIKNVIVTPIRCFVDLEGGDLFVLYHNKFAYYTDNLEAIKFILNGKHSFISINGKNATIGEVYFNSIKYNIVINNNKKNNPIKK